MLAKDDPCINLLRDAVPEFEPTFQREAADEGDALGSFQAMSAFAGWVAERVEARDMAVVARALTAVENLAASDSADLQLAAPLVTEFVEAVQGREVVLALLQPATRSRVRDE